MELAKHFGLPAGAEKLASVEWTTGRTGAPLLPAALAWLECQMVDEHPAGDHVLVLGKVIDGKLLDDLPIPRQARASSSPSPEALARLHNFSNSSRGCSTCPSFSS